MGSVFALEATPPVAKAPPYAISIALVGVFGGVVVTTRASCEHAWCCVSPTSTASGVFGQKRHRGRLSANFVIVAAAALQFGAVVKFHDGP